MPFNPFPRRKVKFPVVKPPEQVSPIDRKYAELKAALDKLKEKPK